MTTINNAIEIKATPEQVWAVLADLDRLAEYDPVVTESVVIGESREGVGARRRCDARQGRFFVEDVTTWEPPSQLQFTIVECNLPTRNLTHVHARTDDNRNPCDPGDGLRHALRRDRPAPRRGIGATKI